MQKSRAIDGAMVADVLAASRQPLVYRLAEVELPVLAGTTGAPIVTYWRQRMRLTGLWVQPSAASWSVPNWAALRLAVTDSAALGLVTDGQLPASVPTYALHGSARRWFPLAIEVASGDRWAWQFTNGAAVAQTPIVLLRWEVRR